MSEMFCARATCCERASASLLINARDLAAQVVDISEETGIAGVSLCRSHADEIVVPLGWTQADLRTPFEESEFEPELVLVDDPPSGSPEALRLPDMEEADLGDMEDAAVGEVPPLLSRAFRAAGLD